MNKHNNWQQMLGYANENLADTGYSILVVEPEEGFYNCEIRKNGELDNLYAENYYEDELSDLINDAWHYIINNLGTEFAI